MDSLRVSMCNVVLLDLPNFYDKRVLQMLRTFLNVFIVHIFFIASVFICSLRLVKILILGTSNIRLTRPVFKVICTFLVN